MTALGLVMTTLLACSPDPPLGVEFERTGDGFVTIRTEKVAYGWSDVSTTGFRATLVNGTDRELRATLGDGYSAAAEQSLLYVAEGSDAFVEKWTGGVAWTTLERPVAFEGVQSVVLRPHATYSLVGQFVGDQATGMFRLKVQYTEAAAPATVYRDYSNIFTVR